MSELYEKRVIFTRCLARLIVRANEKPGQTCAIDQTKRTQAEADANAKKHTGISNSLHNLGLAGDLLLYYDGKYLKDSEDYRDLGTFWKGLHPLARWGGDFKDKKGAPDPDGNHFSIEHDGVK
jgi:hypothetical protein